MNAGKYILVGIIILVVIGLYKNMTSKTDKTQTRQINEDYSVNWTAAEGQNLIDISKCLADNKVEGCGEYYIKTKDHSNREFAIACTADGASFRYYLIWPDNQRVVLVKDEGITQPEKARN